ncbi:MAG TPA: hypothetical protein HA252_01575 [Candidatus Diapherotrites archaeon]|uniref:Ribonuclease P protein component 2 n=1 Tax=Candidatus Iainarchaeum sp. TaxID=3101447 RepID=A0A7J4JFJ7_9ARCH|nr:hypothetical protein [Candidatus Diapherotrites archaeon]HIH16074.1 hypothetical protein [Candidatus Diapherotrites archaeon]
MKNAKQSMNPIPASYRGKKRYVSFSLSAKERLSEPDVGHAVWETFLHLYGEVGTARQKLWLMGFDSKKSVGVVRCALEHLDEVKAGLLFVKQVDGKPVIPKLLGVSGSIGKVKP